jgi:hypothetical protein
MKQLTIALAIGSVIALGACSSPAAPTPAKIDGSYDLTLTASSACSANLPVETRVMKFIANVTQTTATFNVSLLAHVIFNSSVVTGTVNDQTITFSTFSFSEITTAGGIAISSTGTAIVAADGSITGTLNGTYQTPSGATCNAANHQVQMVRR